MLPQLRPALLGGTLLVGLHLLAEFGALQLLRFPTFTTAIYDQYGSTFNGAAANMIAGVLVLLLPLLLLAELRLRGHRRYARVGHGAARPPSGAGCGRLRWPRGRAGRRRWSSLAVGVPDVRPAALAASSAPRPSSRSASCSPRPAAPSSLGRRRRDRHDARRDPGRLARGALPRPRQHARRAQHVRRQRAARHRGRPGPRASSSLRLVPAIYQTALLLVVAYAILFLPRAVVSVRAGLEQAPVVLDHVAHSLGTGPLATARRVDAAADRAQPRAPARRWSSWRSPPS